MRTRQRRICCVDTANRLYREPVYDVLLTSPNIRAVIFDLGRVLVPFDFDRFYDPLAALSKINTEEVRRRIAATGLMPRFESGLEEPEAFARGICEILGLHLTVEEFAPIWFAVFLPEALIPEEMLIQLRQRYRLLLLSNTNVLHFAGLMKNYPVLHHFDHYVLSHEIKAMKPDEAIYRRAVELAQCPAGECLFIDDLPENVAGAQRAGLQAVLFRSLQGLQQDFARLGVEWNDSFLPTPPKLSPSFS